MKISIGADHRGFKLKNAIVDQFADIEWLDVGTDSKDRTDYPEYARHVCENILQGKSELGILICGSGIGISIAANRYKKIYAALCWGQDIARVAREDDLANVLVLPADFVSTEQAFEIVEGWLSAEFKAGEYQERLDMIDNL